MIRTGNSYANLATPRLLPSGKRTNSTACQGAGLPSHQCRAVQRNIITIDTEFLPKMLNLNLPQLQIQLPLHRKCKRLSNLLNTLGKQRDPEDGTFCRMHAFVSSSPVLYEKRDCSRLNNTPDATNGPGFGQTCSK